jgi:tRNA threonylcarbamoyladenosine biosynthesis protein TsaE
MDNFVTPNFEELFESASESASENDTAQHAQSLANVLMLQNNQKYMIVLKGEVGAGKTLWARSFIRKLMNDPNLDVLSPTFPLLQVYESTIGDIYHYDLYRLESDDISYESMQNLAWDEAMQSFICLVEWAEKLPPKLYKPSILISIESKSDSKRLIETKFLKKGGE